MSFKNRLNRLDFFLRNPRGGRGRRVIMKSLRGLEWEQVIAAVDAAVLPESDEVLAGIVDHVEEFHQRPARELPNGEMWEDSHGFSMWLQGLQDGWALLPPVIPQAVFLAWRNGSANHPAGGTPVPTYRCEDCLMVLPNCDESGFGNCLRPCPVCGSERLADADLSKEWGTFRPWTKG